MVIEAGRALVLAFNKWDLVDEERRLTLDKEMDRELRRVPWASRVNISALTGRAVQRLAGSLDEALNGWETRVPTAELNAFIGDLIAATPPPVRGGKQPRVLFATQPGVAPPRFVLFTTGPLEASYRRFIERRLREQYGFIGSPIDIAVKMRERRKR
jgi:GTP-binding protein